MRQRFALPTPQDLFASVVVFLVALPLCMGVAIASGLPPAAGLVTGIVGGLLVGTLAGAPLQVSGPAAGLTVLVYDIVQTFGVAALGPVVLVAGALQLAGGLVRSGRYFQAVPPSVIAGMLAGIGVLIVASQVHVMVGEAPRGSGLANLATIPQAVGKALTGGGSGRAAAALGASVFLMMLAWPLAVTRAPRLRRVPGALVAVVVASVGAALLGLEVALVSLPDSLLGSLSVPGLDAWRLLLEPKVLGAVLALAVIASAETLLCATAVDRLHSGPRTNYDRELAAQGIGNMVCGLFGALPMTGVIVRSSANVEAGAKTRWAAVMHGAWLLLLVAFAPFVLELIPVPALAGLLVFTGYKLVRQDVRALARGGRFEVAIFLLTVGAIVTTDLLKGVLFGLALAVARLVWTLTRLQVRVERREAAGRTDVTFAGSATFLRLPDLASALASVPPQHEVHVHLDGLDFVDHAALETLASWEKQHVARGGKVSLDWNELQLRAQPPKPRAERPPVPLARTAPSGVNADAP